MHSPDESGIHCSCSECGDDCVPCCGSYVEDDAGVQTGWGDDAVCPRCCERLTAEQRDEDDRCSGYSERDCEFADPGGNSALRASSPTNPRNLPCPTCGARNRLTPADRARGYQCDPCADRAEGGGW